MPAHEEFLDVLLRREPILEFISRHKPSRLRPKIGSVTNHVMTKTSGNQRAAQWGHRCRWVRDGTARTMPNGQGFPTASGVGFAIRNAWVSLRRYE